jgi:threonine/homoserine/homoserine lactone efflux protein
MFSSEFMITSLVVVLIPGTGVIYTLSTGLFCGWRASIAAALGCTAGILPHLTASILGLSAIVHMSATAFSLIKLAGAVYLLYLAWSMWRETGMLQFDAQGKKSSYLQTAVKGFLINILNPKLSIFFLAFLPLFIPTGTPSILQPMVFMSLVFMGMTLGIFAAYGICASSVRNCVVRKPTVVRCLQRSFALVFAALAAKLATAAK